MTSKVFTPTPLSLVSMRRLEELLGRPRADIKRISDIAARLYSPFDRRPNPNAKWRHIDNPSDELKLLQKRIQRTILAPVLLPDTMFGGVPGRTVKDNALIHVQQPMVVTLDLKNCFPSIDDKQVFKAFKEKAGCSVEIASILTKLTTFQRRLPQGAPTSSALANLCLSDLHGQISEICRTYGLSLSFWVDDIAVSGDGVLDAMEEVIQAIHASDHAVARKKLRRMNSSQPQVVTGLGVNARVGIPLPKREAIRAEILQTAQLERIANGRLRSINGKIAYVARISPAQGMRLKRLSIELLPEKGTDAPSTKTEERRDCHDFGKHRIRPQLNRTN